MLRPHRTDFVVFNNRGSMLARLPHIAKLNDIAKNNKAALQIS